MKVFAFALLFLAAAGIADDQPAAAVKDAVRGNVPPEGGIIIIPPSGTPATPRYFICPKDETVVRIGRGTPSGELLCPVDGTKMKAGTGPRKSIYLLR
jgi:hypothetical protein